MDIQDNKFIFVTINKEYLEYMCDNDSKVQMEHEGSTDRPYVGVLIHREGINYVLPLASPKMKHIKMKNNIDFHKIDDGLLGALNFNNMIPVREGLYEIVDINKLKNTSNNNYHVLIEKQLRWINILNNKRKILTKANLILSKYKSDSLPNNVMKRCCNFTLLERKCLDWKK